MEVKMEFFNLECYQITLDFFMLETFELASHWLIKISYVKTWLPFYLFSLVVYATFLQDEKCVYVYVNPYAAGGG